MKQFQIAYENDESFRGELNEIERWRAANPSYATVFRIYSAGMDLERIKHVCDMLDAEMPDALYLGCTSNGSILEGALAEPEIILSCTVFEYETTRAKLLQFPFTEENAKDVVRELKAYCDANPWVSAVEMHATVLGMSVQELCSEMSTLRSDIQVFGGGACNSNENDMMTAVFSKESGISMQGIVFLLLGGEDFHIYSTQIAGWTPLRRKFKATKAYRQILFELDGEPAFNIYRRFLNIDRNDKFVTNTLEFPLFVDYNGVDVLRCPILVNDDNSILLTAEVTQGSDVRLAYGDPELILNSILHDGQGIADFQPEVIQTFSCAARRAFWGDQSISEETALFNGVAPTSGFYTAGEFLRADGIVRTFNITLVFAAMREGEPKASEAVRSFAAKLDNIESDRITLIRRFVSFIDASTAEFEDLNRKLAVTSITDGLTGLYNRAEIERRMRSAVDKCAQGEGSGDLSIIMLDIDNFKRINDVYGHREGDHVIIAVADVLRRVLDAAHTSYLGRWGGEEFMVLLPGCDIGEATALAERIREEFATVSYETADRQTVSIGVIQAKDDEDADACYNRVDNAMYKAKEKGKNRVVKLD